MDFTNMPLLAVSKLDGVADLKPKARGYFAKALIAEAKGKIAEADAFLTQAVSSL